MLLVKQYVRRHGHDSVRCAFKQDRRIYYCYAVCCDLKQDRRIYVFSKKNNKNKIKEDIAMMLYVVS